MSPSFKKKGTFQVVVPLQSFLTLSLNYKKSCVSTQRHLNVSRWQINITLRHLNGVLQCNEWSSETEKNEVGLKYSYMINVILFGSRTHHSLSSMEYPKDYPDRPHP